MATLVGLDWEGSGGRRGGNRVCGRAGIARGSKVALLARRHTLPLVSAVLQLRRLHGNPVAFGLASLSLVVVYSSLIANMNDNVLIALDRIKFYAHDAFVTVTQVREVSLPFRSLPSTSFELIRLSVHLPSVSCGPRPYRYQPMSPGQGSTGSYVKTTDTCAEMRP